MTVLRLNTDCQLVIEFEFYLSFFHRQSGTNSAVLTESNYSNPIECRLSFCEAGAAAMVSHFVWGRRIDISHVYKS